MSTPAMHLAPVGKAQRACETCGSMFTPKRGWARFCSGDCRNAFHAAEARVKKIRQRALEMYEALVRIAEGYAQGGDAALLAQAAVKDLKPPVEPKALLEKAKA